MDSVLTGGGVRTLQRIYVDECGSEEDGKAILLIRVTRGKVLTNLQVVQFVLSTLSQFS
jgi:hypothetical protein